MNILMISMYLLWFMTFDSFPVFQQKDLNIKMVTIVSRVGTKKRTHPIRLQGKGTLISLFQANLWKI